jgi:serpin B
MAHPRLGRLRLLPLVLPLAPLLGLSIAGADPAPPPRHDVASFTGHLHGAIARTPGNFLYSPASVSLALAMTREGAAAATATEMDQVLGADLTTHARAFLTTHATVAAPPAGAPPAPELLIANRLFGDRATTFAAPFLTLTGQAYGAPLEALDFREHPDAARATINAWVEAQTKHKIRDLIGPSTLTPRTRLVLVNAIYLKATWASPFPHAATKAGPFVVAGAGKRQVPMMHGKVGARTGRYGGARLVDLPYESGGGEPLAMLIVVPDEAALPAVEARYAEVGPAPFLAAARDAESLALAMPKFSIRTSLELAQTLAKLGMPRAFTDDAEFPAISTTPLKISNVIHQAWCVVDEDGTEAAAATAVVMAEIDSVEQPPRPFAVDRSFLFFIHDGHGNVLFGGRVIDPRAS